MGTPNGNYPPPPPPPTPGYEQVPPQGGVSSDDKTMAMLAHILGAVIWVIGPLIIWMMKKDQSQFVDYHGKEALNFQITMTIAWIAVSIISTVTLGLGCILYPVLWIGGLILCVMAGMAANKGEWNKYPINIRLIK